VTTRWLIVAALCVAGCGSPPLARVAASGNLDDFRKQLAQRLEQGPVDADEARDVADALAEHEIHAAQGEAGRRSLLALTPCASRFDEALKRRAAHDDELAATAALVRVRAGLEPPMSYLEHLRSDEPHWRAAAARSLWVAERPPSRASERHAVDLARAAQWRRKLMLDPSATVRRAAFEAAAEAADPADVSTLLESARLDPDPGARQGAIVALGAVGDRRSVLEMNDLWPRSDEDLRVALVHAWAASSRRPDADGKRVACGAEPDQQPPCLARQKLIRLSQSDGGMAGLIAALELLHDSKPPESDSAEQHAAAVVERRMDDAPARQRVEAIASAPLSWAHLAEAVAESREAHDPRVEAAALARSLELESDERKAALARLRELATKKTLAAEAARAALVEARDGEAASLIAQRGKSPSAVERSLVAQQLARLGAYAAAMRFLGDRDARVRSAAACAILAEPANDD
jgi:hypothetical protein